MKKNLLIGLMILVLGFALKLPVQAGGFEHSMNPMFDNINNMTTQELVAEMKYAVKMRNEGKYYPQDRLKQVEQQMAVNQQKEIDRYEAQLKSEAEVAKKIEDLKEAAIEKAKEKGEEYYEEHKEEIQQQVEDKARKMLGMSETEWIVNKEHYTEMYEKGSEAYEEHAAGYVEAAQKALDAYNAYQQAKADHPEAPETAQNLVGFLNATKEVLTFAGDKMQDTPLRPIGEILNAYGEAAALGDKAAKAAWECIHKGDINPNFKTQYDKGFDQIGLTDLGPVNKTDLMKFDSNLKILDLGDGRFAAFDEDFKLVPIGDRNTMTKAEFEKLQQMYVAYENGKKEDWPKLTIEQLAQLANGESIKVKTQDNWLRSDKFQDFSPENIMDLGHRNMNNVLSDELTRSVDRIINGDQGILDKLADPFTRNGRLREIHDAYNKYLDTLDGTLDKSDIHLKEGFLEYIKKLMEENPDLKMKDILQKLQNEVDKKKGKETDEDKDKDKDKTTDTDKTKKNPLTDKIRKLDPRVKDANSSGVKKDKGTKTTPVKDGHWTTKNPDGFNGKQDSGFTQIGTTYRPIPDPNKLSIPVLKPNIYLYPLFAQDIGVNFKNPEKLTATIPDYSSGWNVTAEPNGILDGKYGYLFYEADVEEIYFQTSASWKLPVKGRVEFFKKILDLYGFNSTEKRDFIEFWNKRLDPDRQYLMYPQETGIIERAMPVKILPQPASIHRIWFYFIPSEEEPVTLPQGIERIIRDGFTVVEWGGMFK